MNSDAPMTDPSTSSNGRPSGRRVLILLALGLPLAALAATAATFGLVAPAWGICGEDMGLTPGLTLLFSVLPRLLAATFAAYVVGVLVTSRLRPAIRLTAGIFLGLWVLLLGVTFVVPYLGEADPYYASVPHGTVTECGSNGIPTWWPTWLPH